MFKKFTSKFIRKTCGAIDAGNIQTRTPRNVVSSRKDFFADIGIKILSHFTSKTGQEIYTGIDQRGSSFSITVVTLSAFFLIDEKLCLEAEQLIAQISSWNHPFIANFVAAEFCQDTNEFFLFTENFSKKLSMIAVENEKKLQSIIYQILRALEFLKENKIEGTGNINSDSIYIDDEGNVKIQNIASAQILTLLNQKKKQLKPRLCPITFLKDDLNDLKYLILGLIQKVKVSPLCINFTMFLEARLAENNTDINDLFNHTFMKNVIIQNEFNDNLEINNNTHMKSKSNNTRNVNFYDESYHTRRDNQLLEEKFNSSRNNSLSKNGQNKNHPYIVELNQSKDSLEINTSLRLASRSWQQTPKNASNGSKNKLTFEVNNDEYKNSTKGLTISTLLNEQTNLLQTVEIELQVAELRQQLDSLADNCTKQTFANIYDQPPKNFGEAEGTAEDISESRIFCHKPENNKFLSTHSSIRKELQAFESQQLNILSNVVSRNRQEAKNELLNEVKAAKTANSNKNNTHNNSNNIKISTFLQKEAQNLTFGANSKLSHKFNNEDKSVKNSISTRSGTSVLNSPRQKNISRNSFLKTENKQFTITLKDMDDSPKILSDGSMKGFFVKQFFSDEVGRVKIPENPTMRKVHSDKKVQELIDTKTKKIINNGSSSKTFENNRIKTSASFHTTIESSSLGGIATFKRFSKTD